MRVTMIGHSTVLLEGSRTRLITDPYFGTFGNPAYARLHPPARSREDLHDVDGVLVSHGHWDHTDRKYFRSLEPSVPVIVPSRTSFQFRLKGARNVVPVREWESRTIGDAAITAVPASHIGRTVGYVVQMDGVCAYFAGDTYHRPFMAELGKRFRIDVALIPVATFRIPMTMGERGAVDAVRDLRPGTVIPIHLGLQPRVPFLRTSQSPEGFERRMRECGLEANVVHLGGDDHWESPAISA